MTIDLTPVAASMEMVVSGVVAVALAAMAAMAMWDWLRACLIAQWDRDHQR
jgi:hypothetical protein